MASKSKSTKTASKAAEPTEANSPAAVTEEPTDPTTGTVDRTAVVEEVGERDVSDAEVSRDVEVAARSVDMEEPSTEHRKVFVLGPDPSSPDSNPYTESRDYSHEPNKAAVRQYMIDQGLWPTEPVRFVSGKRHDDGISWVLTYAVEAIPAHEAPGTSPNPEVIGDDTDNGGAEKAVNADATPESTEEPAA